MKSIILTLFFLWIVPARVVAGGKKGKKGKKSMSCFNDEKDVLALGSEMLASFWKDVRKACGNQAALSQVLDVYFDDNVMLTPPGATEPAFTNLEQLKTFAVGDLANRCNTQMASWTAFEASLVDGKTFVWRGNEVRVPFADQIADTTSRIYEFSVSSRCTVQFSTVQIFAEDLFDTCG